MELRVMLSWTARVVVLAMAAYAALTLAIAPAPTSAEVMQAMNADTLERILPAVVNISSWKMRPGSKGSDQPARARVQSFGSGFVIDPSGIIVTNRHVIEGAQTITVGFLDKTHVPARLVAAANLVDLAVLKVDAGKALPVLGFADSDALRVGDPVLAIGNPLGVGMSVSSGIISALNRDIMDTPYDDFLQTDAAINHGNSGGPLVDKAGRVVGVNTAIYSSAGNTGSIGLGFSIPANDVQFAVRHLLDPEHMRPGWLGLRVQEITPEIANTIGLGRVSGALVVEPDAGSPGARAGIREGDVVLRFAGKDVADSRAFMRLVVSSAVGRAIPLVIWRDRREETVSATIEQSPTDTLMPNTAPVAAARRTGAKADLGLHLSLLTESARRDLGLPPLQRGAVVSGVDVDSPVADHGLQQGDVIMRVGDDAVAGPADVHAHLEQARRQGLHSVLVLVRAKSGPRWVPVPLDLHQ
jgi:serine protease Do